MNTSNVSRGAVAATALCALLCAAGCASGAGSAGAAGPTSGARGSAAASTPPHATASTSAPQAAGSAPNPCGLLSAAQVGAVLGTAVTASGPSPAPGAHGEVCTFSAGHPIVIVQTYPTAAAYNPRQQLTTPTAMNGPWDHGALDTSSGTALYVRGSVTVTIDDLMAQLSAAQLTRLATESASHL